MFEYKIITDSSSGITQEEAKKLGVKVLPLTLIYKEKEYKDGIDISTDEFYNLLFGEEEKKGFLANLRIKRDSDFPKSTLVKPLDFKDTYDEILAEGKTPVVLPIAQVLSGTYQSAILAKDMLDNPDDVLVFNSKTALGAVRLIILCLLNKAYETKDDFVNEMNYLINHIEFFAVPDTLEYLYKGGRLSRVNAVVGNLLHLKPIIWLNDEGKLTPIEKVRGLKQAFQKTRDIISEKFPIDLNYPIDFGYSSQKENVLSFQEYMKDLIGESSVTQISPVVGAHVGPGASAIFYICQKSKDEIK